MQPSTPGVLLSYDNTKLSDMVKEGVAASPDSSGSVVPSLAVPSPPPQPPQVRDRVDLRQLDWPFKLWMTS